MIPSIQIWKTKRAFGKTSIHEIFTPKEKEIIFAEKVVREIDSKKAQGIGVFTVDGKMIDIAFYDGAKRIIELAKASGVYEGEQ